MALYYAVGSALVTDVELREKQLLEDFNFKKAATFSTGKFDPSTSLKKFENAAGEVTPFEPIGIGRPLIAELRQVYTGRYPHRKKSKDLLVTSAMKSFGPVAGAPRAINYLLPRVGANRSITSAPATEAGTPLIFYSPSLAEYNSNITIEFGFDEFEQETFDIIGDLFTSASGIPVFASASVYLLAAGIVTKLAGKLGSLLLDKRQVFQSTAELHLLRGGAVAAEGGFALLTDDRNALDRESLMKFGLNKRGELVDAAGVKYAGEAPYAVISYDGRQVDKYKDFTPVQASAELLDRFYSVRDSQQATAKLVLDSLKLYNDFKFRERADELQKRIGGLPDGAEKDSLKKERDAVIANIVEEIFKPK